MGSLYQLTEEEILSLVDKLEKNGFKFEPSWPYCAFQLTIPDVHHITYKSPRGGDSIRVGYIDARASRILKVDVGIYDPFKSIIIQLTLDDVLSEYEHKKTDREPLERIF